MALPVLALISMASSLLAQDQKDRERQTMDLNNIEGQRLGDATRIYSRGKAGGGNYASMVRPLDRSDNGLAGALQLVGSLGSLMGGGGDSAKSSEPEGLKLDQPSLLKDYDPERDAKWKGGVTMVSSEPLTETKVFGSDKLDPFEEPTVDNEDERLASRLSRRGFLSSGGL